MGRFYSKKVSNEFGDFDSTTEYEYFLILKKLEDEGKITNLERQKPFTLIESFKDKNNKTIRRMDYLSDFSYYQDGEFHIVDVKPNIVLIEQVFKNKWKMMKWIYRDWNYHIIIKDKSRNWTDLEDKQQVKAMKEREKSIPKKSKSTKKKTTKK